MFFLKPILKQQGNNTVQLAFDYNMNKKWVKVPEAELVFDFELELKQIQKIINQYEV
jgi:hypothetical protein